MQDIVSRPVTGDTQTPAPTSDSFSDLWTFLVMYCIELPLVYNAAPGFVIGLQILVNLDRHYLHSYSSESDDNHSDYSI